MHPYFKYLIIRQYKYDGIKILSLNLPSLKLATRPRCFLFDFPCRVWDFGNVHPLRRP